MALTKITSKVVPNTAITGELGETPVNKAGDTITGKLLVNDGNSSYTSGDANGYPRFTGTSSSAQVGLFRGGDSSAGGMYVGADNTSFSVWDNTFTRRLTVTQGGAVTMPTQPFVRLVGAGNSVKTAASAVVNTFIVAEYSGTASNWTASTGRYTAPIAGRYQISMIGNMNTDSPTLSLQVRKNGTATVAYVYQQNYTTSAWVSPGGTVITALAQNDYIDFVNLSGNLGFDSSNWFNLSITLVG